MSTFRALVTYAGYGENPLCAVGFCPVVWLLPVDLYPSVRYEGFMLACLAAHQPQAGQSVSAAFASHAACTPCLLSMSFFISLRKSCPFGTRGV